MANRSERNRDDERDKNVIGGKDESVQPEAIPGGDREQDASYDSSTGGAGEIEDPSERPPAAQRGRDLDH